MAYFCSKTYERYVQYCYKLKVSSNLEKGKSNQKVCLLYAVPESWQYLTCITNKIHENWHFTYKLEWLHLTSSTRFFWWTCEASSSPPELDSLCLGSGLAFRSTWMVSGSMMDWAVSSSAVREQENTSKDWRVHDKILSWAFGRKFSMAVLCIDKTTNDYISVFTNNVNDCTVLQDEL